LTISASYNWVLLLASGPSATSGNGAAGAFSGSGIGPSALAVGGKAPAMTQSPVRPNIDESADILLNFTPQIAFSQVFSVY